MAREENKRRAAAWKYMMPVLCGLSQKKGSRREFQILDVWGFGAWNAECRFECSHDKLYNLTQQFSPIHAVRKKIWASVDLRHDLVRLMYGFPYL